MKRITKPDGNYTSPVNIRLKAYEDTGLDPQDVLNASEMTKIYCSLKELNQYRKLGDINRLQEALQKQSEYEEFMERWKDAVALAGAVKEIGTDRVAELVEADKAGRCFVLLVAPDPYAGEGEEQVIVCEDGEATPWNVTEVTIGPDGNGEMNIVYDTEGPTFQTSDIGKTVFLPHETDKIEAALAKMREEGCE